MLKITFKLPIFIKQHGLTQQCKFVICESVEFGSRYATMLFGDSVDRVVFQLIESIEPYKL